MLLVFTKELPERSVYPNSFQTLPYYVVCVLSTSLRIQCLWHLINGAGSNFSEINTNYTNITELPDLLLSTCLFLNHSAFSFLDK